jgi:hypothetical protein
MKKWILRNLVCRFSGHRGEVRMPLFVPWFKHPDLPSMRERGSIHCARCGAMTGSY